MTIKVSVKVEPVGSTAKLTVVEQRQKEGTEEWEELSRNVVDTTVATESAVVELDHGERIVVTMEPAKKVVMDHEQSAAKVEEVAKPKEEVVPVAPASKSGAGSPSRTGAGK